MKAFFVKATPVSYVALAASVSGWILLPICGGMIGLLLGLFALLTAGKEGNKFVPGTAVALGVVNLLSPLFFAGVFGGISLCSLLVVGR